MKKAVSSFLAAAALMAAPGALTHYATGFAQAAPASGQIVMDPAEYTDYDNAMNKQTTPQTQAPALEAYLAKYPKSTVKNDVMQRIMLDYYQFDHAKAITAADNYLKVVPDSLQALVIEVTFRTEQLASITDPAAKQAALDTIASYAQQALALTSSKGMPQAGFDGLKAQMTPVFDDAIASDDLGKKDYADAITVYKSELSAVPIADTEKVGLPLQDTFLLGQSYELSTPPDLVDCAFYTTRAAAYAPEPYKSQFQSVANYCYKRYHGGMDGYDAVVAAAKANLNPPAGFSIVPAPSDADIAAQTIASTPDPSKLAIQDKEFILANGTQLDPNSGTVDPATGKKDPSTQKTDAAEVFDSVKGKQDTLPNATVVSATPDEVQVAFSDDAIQSKTADFTFQMKTPLKTVPAVGDKVTLTGIWTSYTPKPLNIVMTDGEVVKPTPARKPPVRRR
jgi:hypothetical protein